MDKQKMILLKEKIQEAELVLVGIGEEWKITQSVFENNSGYKKAIKFFGEESPVIPYVKKVLLDMSAEEEILFQKNAYQMLADILKNKNYFIVSLCEDELILNADFNTERIVTPCGTLGKTQCRDACHDKLYEPEQEFLDEIRKWLQDESKAGAEAILNNMPVCPECGNEMVFNTVAEENYLEAGYLPKWQIYMKWLQGTVNKKVCVLELGVGMKYPTVIRWPFEKITFFNQKATHFRVHSTLYQTAEEIKEKSYGIKATKEDFFRELSTCD